LVVAIQDQFRRAGPDKRPFVVAHSGESRKDVLSILAGEFVEVEESRIELGQQLVTFVFLPFVDAFLEPGRLGAIIRSQSGAMALNPTGQLNRTGAFDIGSFGNGLGYQIIRRVDGATVFLQGDDGLRFAQELEQTTERFTDDDVASQFFE